MTTHTPTRNQLKRMLEDRNQQLHDLCEAVQRHCDKWKGNPKVADLVAALAKAGE